MKYPVSIQGEKNQSISPGKYSAHGGDVERVQHLLVWMQENLWNRVLLERGTNLFAVWTGL